MKENFHVEDYHFGEKRADEERVGSSTPANYFYCTTKSEEREGHDSLVEEEEENDDEGTVEGRACIYKREGPWDDVIDTGTAVVSTSTLPGSSRPY